MLCNDYKCGVCGANISESMKHLFENYNYYKKNALAFSNFVDYDGRIPNLSKQIVDKLDV